MKNKNTKNFGFTLIELLIAITIFALGTSAIISLIMDSYKNSIKIETDTHGLSLAEEAIEAIRAMRDNNFLIIENGQHGVSNSSGYWELSGTGNIIDDRYTQYITIEDVYRDGSGNMTSSGGLIDENTKKITSTVSWTDESGIKTVRLFNYLTNYRGFDIIDTLKDEFGAGDFTNTGIGTESPPPQENGLIQLQETNINGNFFANLNFGESYIKSLFAIIDFLGTGMNFLFAGAYNNEYEFIVSNVTDPNNPFETESLETHKLINDIFILENFAYLAVNEDHDGLKIIDLSELNQSPCPDDIVSLWSFDGDGFPGEDVKGNYDGTLQGATWSTQGMMGGAVKFDGTNDYIDLGSNINIPGDELTISAWFKADTFGEDPRIISKASGTDIDDHYWLLGLNDISSSEATLRFRLKTDDGTKEIEGGTINNGDWIHAVATYNKHDKEMRLYQNGNLVANAEHKKNIKTSNSVSAWIGGNPPDAERRPFEGTIDDVAIFTRSLSENEIIGMYKAGINHLGICTTVGQGEILQMNEVAELNIGGKGQGIFVKDNYAYITTNKHNKGLVIVDVSDPENPQVVSEVDFNGFGHEVYVVDNYAYIASPFWKLVVIDISNPASPLIEKEIFLIGSADNIDVSYNYLFLVVNQFAGFFNRSYLVTFDISDLSNPIFLESIMLDEPTNDIAVLDNYAYLAVEHVNKGLGIVNVSYPPVPYLVTYVDVGFKGEAVFAAGDYVFMSIHKEDGGGLLSITGTSYSGFEMEGTYTSKIFDTGSDDSQFKYIDWHEELSPSGTIKFQIRTSDTQGNISSEVFVGPDGTSATFYESPRKIIALDPETSGTRFIQYKVYLTGDGASSPLLKSVKINYTP